MIITDISIYPTTQKLIKSLKTSNFNHNDRDSWIIKITTKEGYTGFGEASPISNFNDETFEASGYALEGFKLTFDDQYNIETDELMILIKAHTLGTPSAKFAIETAVYDILSQQKKIPLCKFLNLNALSQIFVNGVHQLTNFDDYSIIKVKCGFRNLYDEIELLENLVAKFDSDISFIIDLNQAYDLLIFLLHMNIKLTHIIRKLLIIYEFYLFAYMLLFLISYYANKRFNFFKIFNTWRYL